MSRGLCSFQLIIFGSQVCEYLDGRQCERRAQGEVRTETGGEVIDEEEYHAITQLKKVNIDC